MGMHLNAFSGNIAQGSNQVAIPPVVDNVFTNSLNGVFVGQSRLVAGVFVIIPAGERASLSSPSWRPFGPPDITPFTFGPAPPNLPPIYLPEGNGPVVPPNDPFNILVSRAGTVPALCQALAWTTDRFPTRLTGQVFTVNATATSTVVANNWTLAAMSITQALPGGRYRVCGMAAFGEGLLGARLVFNDQVERPGCLAQDAVNEYDWKYFRYGNLGEWGTFLNTTPPNVELIAYEPGTVEAVIKLDLMRM